MFNLLNRLNNKKGFTLVELMVVVVIIGILVAIIIPIYNNVQDNAAKKAHEANLRTIDGAISMYMAEHDDEPTDIDALKDYLPEVPTIPTRLTGDKAKEFFEESTLKQEGEDNLFVYHLAPSFQAGGQKRAFPVLKEGEGTYRVGDTPKGTTGGTTDS